MLDDFIPCAYCKGRGTDRFDILSAQSKCPVCLGNRDVRVPEPRVACRFCAGTGVQPHRRLSCGGCRGTGYHTVPAKRATCSHCGGRGHDNSDVNLACVMCHGSGVVAETTCRGAMT